MQIRLANCDDAEAIAAIYNDEIVGGNAVMWHEPRPVRVWRERLNGRPDRHPVLVAAESAGPVVGFTALGSYDPQCGYEEVAEWSLYVAAAARGQGLGWRLAEAVLAAGRTAGLHSVLSRVTGDNAASHRLHARLGFRQVGVFEQLGRKFGRRHDVVVYQLVL